MLFLLFQHVIHFHHVPVWLFFLKSLIFLFFFHPFILFSFLFSISDSISASLSSFSLNFLSFSLDLVAYFSSFSFTLPFSFNSSLNSSVGRTFPCVFIWHFTSFSSIVLFLFLSLLSFKMFSNVISLWNSFLVVHVLASIQAIFLNLYVSY